MASYLNLQTQHHNLQHRLVEGPSTLRKPLYSSFGPAVATHPVFKPTLPSPPPRAKTSCGTFKNAQNAMQAYRVVTRTGVRVWVEQTLKHQAVDGSIKALQVMMFGKIQEQWGLKDEMHEKTGYDYENMKKLVAQHIASYASSRASTVLKHRPQTPPPKASSPWFEEDDIIDRFGFDPEIRQDFGMLNPSRNNRRPRPPSPVPQKKSPVQVLSSSKARRNHKLQLRRQRDPQLRSAALFTIPEMSTQTQMDTAMAESTWNGMAQFSHLADPVQIVGTILEGSGDFGANMPKFTSAVGRNAGTEHPVIKRMAGDPMLTVQCLSGQMEDGPVSRPVPNVFATVACQQKLNQNEDESESMPLFRLKENLPWLNTNNGGLVDELIPGMGQISLRMDPSMFPYRGFGY